ncbi:MAG: hypothetical protein Ct9H300mP16_05690 [Pseudomonadota bacterium]|nr:MAG: hypothetical protein Ct9H300mP16_05690 [Pseudomonadota bacterium]
MKEVKNFSNRCIVTAMLTAVSSWRPWAHWELLQLQQGSSDLRQCACRQPDPRWLGDLRF